MNFIPLAFQAPEHEVTDLHIECGFVNDEVFADLPEPAVLGSPHVDETALENFGIDVKGLGFHAGEHVITGVRFSTPFNEKYEVFLVHMEVARNVDGDFLFQAGAWIKVSKRF